MPIQDAARWNARYLSELRNITQPRSLLTEFSRYIPKTGLALDVAMGMGANACFLQQCGLRVIGVDISIIAVQKAKAQCPGLSCVVADLADFYLPPHQFDLIANFLYLQRDLWTQFVQGLKRKGVLFIECLTKEMLSIHPDIEPKYLLEKGELLRSFSSKEMSAGVELLYFYEGWQASGASHPRAVARLIVRKTS